MAKNLTHKRLLELLEYDLETGLFIWRSAKGKGRSRQKPGSIAGTDTKGHVQIKIDGELYYAHRLAWLYVHGVWPTAEIDHKKRKKDDNRIASLREATHRENMFNTCAHSNSSSGIKGVDWNSKDQRWRARIRTADGRKHLGSFLTKEEAAAAYESAANQMHGEFSNPTKCTFAPLGAS